MSADPASVAVTSVLIVDDSRVQRSHSAHLCHELGIAEVLEAGNGREALALLAAMPAKPGVMIVDLEMPTMDGPELLMQLHQRGIDVPIIVASSRERMLIDSVQQMGGCLGLRVQHALQKPLQLDDLRKALLSVGQTAVRRAKDQTWADAIDEKALGAALDRGEISVHFQPKTDLRTGLVRGVEALARWQHPQMGFVPPDRFIAVAERGELIHRLTLEVMHQAMLQAAGWEARGLHLTLAVNLSPLLLERPDLPQEIASLAQCHGLSPERIVLEITESSLMSQPGLALGVLARLRLKGFGLSIDDYGTGFSSLAQLTRIAFTELKIDRSFVRHAPQRESLQVILRSAIDLSNELGLACVAEGVETMEEWRLLQQYGCTLAQGWLIAKAMPGGDIVEWCRRHRQRVAELRAAQEH
ncbi:MAG TPA: EAL domain-containing response regulator [Povalibacter sp.]|jgi:EAL domain-containing protein (putative c-di-GMP-specific phosphodiesterase class I)|nr:EAL domain-containing response regulator [Povalibacter sp.]